MTPSKEPSCEFCEKKGLAVLPVRYAVAGSGSSAPRLAGSFKIDPAPDLGSAHYSARLLRSGYLYVFDEARKRWEEYFVTPDSYYFKLPPRGPNVVKPALPQAFACKRSGHAPLASCITIRDPKRATTVWFGFSDVEWTDAVMKKHESAAWRARHMRRITLRGGKVAPGTAHTGPITEVDNAVAEYALEPGTGVKAFNAWSPFAYTPRQANARDLKQAAERLLPGAGIVLALDDPAGVATELALLMKHHADVFAGDPRRKRGLAVSSAIQQLEAAIKHQAELQEIAAAEDLANRQTAEAGPALMFKSVRQGIEDIRTVTTAELERAANDEWAKYTAKYDEPARAAWQSAFAEQLAQFDGQFIVPLALAHVAWLKSPRMTSYFQCNYDTADMRSGAVYTAVLGLCIASTPDKKACFDLYDQWLLGDPTDHSNLLLRALAYNQDVLAAGVQEATTNAADWRGLAWDKVIEAHDKATSQLLEGQPDELGRLIGMVTGPIARSLKQAAGSPRVYAGLVAVGAASRQPIVQVEIEGGRKAFRALLVREMLRLHGEPLRPHQIQRAVAAELRRLQIHGVKLEGSDKKRWLLMVDPAEVKAMPANLGAQARAQWLARTIRTPEQVEQLNLHRFRLQVSRASGVVRSGVPFAFGIVGVAANAVALDSLLDEEREAMRHGKAEAKRRVYAQGAQLIGATAGMVELALERISTAGVTVGRLAGPAARVFGLIGRFFGIGGSAVMAAWDGWRADQERREGNFAGMAAYGVSAGLGAAATVLLAIGWTGWGLIVVVAMIAWAFIMPLLVDNRLQDWLERCLWGRLAGQRYGDLNAEMEQLKVALKA